MAWYFQTSPHDMHDWDSAQTPILVDGTINGRPRKLVSTAARNGYFFTLDRVTGEHLSTSKYGSATNWANGLTPKGGPRAESRQGRHRRRLARVADAGGTINWEPPAFTRTPGCSTSPSTTATRSST